jgi:alpha-L-fucosidase
VVETTSELNRGKLGGERFIPAEVDVSIRPGWFYHAEQDDMVRSPQNLVNLWFTSIGSNAGFLLNLPPDRRGLIHENDVKSIKEFNDYIESTLENNLAKDAKVTGEHLFDCEGKNLLTQGSFFLPKSNSFEVVLPEKRKFNTLMVSEGIELGHKVTGIKASALVEGKWQELFAGEIIGYKLAERFDTVVSDRVRVELFYLDTPVLRDFGLYLFEESLADQVKRSNKNLAQSESAVIEVGNKEIDVNLGGLFPFDTVRVEGVPNNSYKLYVFNGTNFDLYAQGESVDGKINAKFDLPVDNAYRLNVKFDKEIEKDVKIEVTLS